MFHEEVDGSICHQPVEQSIENVAYSSLYLITTETFIDQST